MKISKIGALCKAQKRFTVCNVGGEQWLSDGYGYYPLGDLPRLDGDNIFTMFDVAEDKREKYYVEEKHGMPNGIDVSDVTQDEVLLKYVPIWLVVSGAVMLPLIAEGRVLFVDKRYFSPFDFSVECYERKAVDGKSYIVTKRGMIACGVITPEQIGTAALADQLCELGELVAASTATGAKPSQMSFDDEDEEK
jgi:hypothetical protein